MNTKILPVVSVLLLAACAQFGARDDYWLPPTQSRPSGPAAALLLYADYLRNLPAPDYPQELDHVRLLAAKDRSFYRQLQYALALSAPGGDARTAQQVIDGAAREHRNSDAELGALAGLLSAELAERRRLEARMEAGAKRADNLEKKVEAVKNIEKNMIQRDGAVEEKK